MPAADGWAFEVKFDGMRLQLRSDGRNVCPRSRPGRDRSEEFPELAAIESALGRHRVLLDGELVCLGADGSPDFASLRSRLRAPADKARRNAQRAPCTFLAFDVLHVDGRSTRELPYERRRELLLDLPSTSRVGGRRATSPRRQTGFWPRPESMASRASSPRSSAAHTWPARATALGSSTSTAARSRFW
jgi:ATP-dependent DNA ligase